MKKDKEDYQYIYQKINEDPNLKQASSLGNCRIWTRGILLIIHELNKNNDYNIIAEARESQIEPFLFHTFIRLSLDGECFYLFDGIGTIKLDPYFGPEDEAPEHLKKNRSDIINSYL